MHNAISNQFQRIVSLFALSSILYSCAENKDFDQIPKEAPDDVIEYFNEFYNAAHDYNVDVKWKALHVEYVDQIVGDRIAFIDRGGIGKDKILIDTTSYQFVHYKKGMIFREFGRYYLNRFHVVDWDSTFFFKVGEGMEQVKLPPSIMTTTRIIPDRYINYFWADYYIPELFEVFEPNADSLIHIIEIDNGN